VITDKIYPATMLRKKGRRQVSEQYVFPKRREEERSHCILSSLPGRKQDAVQRKKSKLEK